MEDLNTVMRQVDALGNSHYPSRFDGRTQTWFCGCPVCVKNGVAAPIETAPPLRVRIGRALGRTKQVWRAAQG